MNEANSDDSDLCMCMCYCDERIFSAHQVFALMLFVSLFDCKSFKLVIVAHCRSL